MMLLKAFIEGIGIGIGVMLVAVVVETIKDYRNGMGFFYKPGGYK